MGRAKMKTYKRVLTAILILTFFFSIKPLYLLSQQPDLTLEQIFEDPKIEGSRPYSATFSPDGKMIAYLWKDSERDTTTALWSVFTTGGKSEKIIPNIKGGYRWLPYPDEKKIMFREKRDVYVLDLTTGEKEKINGNIKANSFPIFSPCGKFIAFPSKDGIWKVEIKTKKATQLTLQRGMFLQWSPDGNKIAYIYNSNLWVVYTKSRKNVKLTNEPELKERRARGWPFSMSGIRQYYWSPDGNYILFVKRKPDTPERDIFVANYLTKYVTKRPARNSFPDSRCSIITVGLISLKKNKNKLKWIDLGEEKHFYFRGGYWAPDSKKFAIVKVSEDQHNRHIIVVNAKTGEPSIVDHEYDKAWIGGPGFYLFWTKDSNNLIFTSERNGYNHLFKVNVNTSILKQMTEGNWEINYVIMHPDSQRLLYSSTKVSPAERHFYIISTDGGWAKKLQTEKGYNKRAIFSKDGRYILYLHTDLATPDDYFVLDLESNSKPVQITYTVPQRFKIIDWTIPEFVTFKSSKDNETIYARIYKPENFNKDKKYPCVIFVHGAGYLQNIIRSWTPYSENFKFHHRLVQKGYIVFDIDYRGSAGYGRKFRTDVYLDMGGIDLEDELDGVKYLETLGYIDMKKIGIYGGSYGGFMTLMALFKAPDTFACGAALRSVTDWANYNAPYTQARLGFLPENKKIYEKCSPIYYAENLKKPLLLMHGLVDDNVFCQDSFQLAEKLIKLGKDFELMIYPSQRHGFTDPKSWIDEYGRIEKLFDRYLK
ncbi:hypothetical protein DRQ09_10500 [candidate division KSB1 bacterium]|nr:MAG: hypothetical protein DRQ09_10500 [candidate division KSB1 bacterium]